MGGRLLFVCFYRLELEKRLCRVRVPSKARWRGYARGCRFVLAKRGGCARPPTMADASEFMKALAGALAGAA